MISSKDFKFDDERRVVEVDGIKYAYKLFEALGKNGFAKGTLFRIYDRDDTVTIEEVAPLSGSEKLNTVDVK